MEVNPEREKYLLGLMGITFYSHAVGFIYSSRSMMTPFEYFGRLFEWAKLQDFWGHFLNEYGVDTLDTGPLLFGIPQDLIDPGNFAQALYTFLTEVTLEAA